MSNSSQLASLLLAVACLTVAGVHCDSVPFSDCGSVSGKIVSVDVSSCSSLPCQLKRGTTAEVKVTYQSSVASSSVKAVVHGIIGGVSVPFPLPDSNACNTMSPKCPTASGQQYQYSASLDVKSIYPAVKLMVQWELQDSNGKDLVCFKLPAQIV